jgi:hypothetical protein
MRLLPVLGGCCSFGFLCSVLLPSHEKVSTGALAIGERYDTAHLPTAFGAISVHDSDRRIFYVN